MTKLNRRDALGALAFAAMAPMWPRALGDGDRGGSGSGKDPLYRISLAQWSLHRALRAGAFTNLEFPATAAEMGFGAVEYVNRFFEDRDRDRAYLAELNRRAKDAGTKQLLIMVDGEGRLGDPDDAERKKAVERHERWLETAKVLGCHSIRVNAASEGSYEVQMGLAADGLGLLAERAAPMGLGVIVENHGGLSSNGQWLAGVMERVGMENLGTLPDFGNFCMDWGRKDEADAWYDRYRGVRELMPYAKAVSAKSHAFDEAGNETGTDYLRMMGIVVDAGYRGWVGVEYEGDAHTEREGALLTKALLERVRDELAG